LQFAATQPRRLVVQTLLVSRPGHERDAIRQQQQWGGKVLVRLLASCGRNRGRQQLDQMPEEEGLLLEFQMNGLCCTSYAQHSAVHHAQLYDQTDHALDGHYSSQAAVISVDHPSVELSPRWRCMRLEAGDCVYDPRPYCCTMRAYRTVLFKVPYCSKSFSRCSRVGDVVQTFLHHAWTRLVRVLGARRLLPTAPATRSLS
jgi:hypothetical protein